MSQARNAEKRTDRPAANRRRLGAVLLCLLLCGGVFFFSTKIRQGVNGNVRSIRMPFGVKVMEFASRDFQYRRITKEIIGGARSDSEKALRIFRWVRANIHQDYPRTWDTIDDHILNIIIRRYGAADQRSDVFTTLCAYAGMNAFWDKCSSKEGESPIILAFVQIDGRWRIFDMRRDAYYTDADGAIADVNDIIRGEADLQGFDDPRTGLAVDHAAYLTNERSVKAKAFFRAGNQALFSRIYYEVRRLLGGDEYIVVKLIEDHR
ncbi:MAG: hypothetical protein ABIJ27_07530 [Candidatus Omnitrophota bacterium]